MIEWLDIRTLIRIAFGLLAAYLLFLAAAFALMRQPPERFASAIGSVPRQLFLIVPFETLWSNARAGRLELGAEAPDFDLESLDKKSRVRLSSLRGEKPVALIFGSYT